MLKDLRHAVRMLLQAKGWTAVVVLSLALGIGANTALFSAINGLLLKTVPAKDPDTLVRFRYAGRNDMATSSSDYGFSTERSGRTDTSAARSRIRCFSSSSPTTDDDATCSRARRSAASTSSSTARRRLRPPSSRPATTIRCSASRRAPRPHDPAGRRQADGAAGGGDQLEVLALAVRRPIRPSSARRSRVNNVPVTDRRRARAGVHRRAAAGRRAARCRAAARARCRSSTRRRATSPPRLSQPTYWWLQVMGRLKPGVTAAQVQGNLEGVSSRRRAPGSIRT